MGVVLRRNRTCGDPSAQSAGHESAELSRRREHDGQYCHVRCRDSVDAGDGAVRPDCHLRARAHPGPRRNRFRLVLAVLPGIGAVPFRRRPGRRVLRLRTRDDLARQRPPQFRRSGAPARARDPGRPDGAPGRVRRHGEPGAAGAGGRGARGSGRAPDRARRGAAADLRPGLRPVRPRVLPARPPDRAAGGACRHADPGAGRGDHGGRHGDSTMVAVLRAAELPVHRSRADGQRPRGTGRVSLAIAGRRLRPGQDPGDQSDRGERLLRLAAAGHDRDRGLQRPVAGRWSRWYRPCCR